MAHRRVGVLTKAEKEAGLFSTTLEMKDIRLGGKVVRCGVMGSREVMESGKEIPVVLAISGEAQQHVSRFFQAWKVEGRGWVSVTPLRPDGYGLFFEGEKCVKLLKTLVEHLKTTFNVEGGKVHIVGTSNGGTSAWHYATHHPEDVASIHVVTGSLTRHAHLNIAATLSIPTEIYIGDSDELGFYPALLDAKAVLDEVKHPKASLHVLPGAGHFNIGQYINMSEFWARLEAYRVRE